MDHREDYMKYKNPQSPWSIELNHEDETVTLKYNKHIIESEDEYAINLAEIAKSIDWCIRKSYKEDTCKS